MTQSVFFAPADRRALVIPGLPADKTYTFSIRAYRGVDKDVALGGVILSDAVATVPYKPEEGVAFEGDITGTIQGRPSLQVVLNLEAIASDSVLSTAEKPALIIEYNQIVDQAEKLDAKAATFGTKFDTLRNALTAALNSLNAYLDTLAPAWDDSSQHSVINPAIFRDTWGLVYERIADLSNAFARGALAEVDNIDAGGPLFIGTLPPSKADPGLINANIPLGSNVVVNSDFTRGIFGWIRTISDPSVTFSTNLPGWHGRRNVAFMTRASLGVGVNIDANPDALWNGGALASAPRFALPVSQGDRVFARALLAPHRCTGQVWLLVFDRVGTLVQAEVMSGGTPGGAGNGENFGNPVGLIRTIDNPASAWAIVMIRMIGTGEADPYLFFAEPMITKVAPGQTAFPAYTSGRADGNADVTITISGPSSDTLTYTSTGVLDPAEQLPRTYVYELNSLSGPITSGATWNYRIIEGTVNGFAASSTLRSMSVSSGAGQFALSSLGSNSAQVEILGSFSSGGDGVSMFLQLTKAFASPPTGGSGGGGPASASQSSGFSSVTLSTMATISNELDVTSTGTTQTVTVNMQFSPPLTFESSNTIELQLERWNGAAWVAMGAAVSANSSTLYDVELNRYIRSQAVFNFSRTATITAGSNQRTRLRARRSVGTANHTASGTLTLTA